MGLVHTTVLGSDAFELTIDGEPAAIETLFESFSEHDRLALNDREPAIVALELPG